MWEAEMRGAIPGDSHGSTVETAQVTAYQSQRNPMGVLLYTLDLSQYLLTEFDEKVKIVSEVRWAECWI